MTVCPPETIISVECIIFLVPYYFSIRGDQEEEEEDMSLDEDAEEGDASRKGDRYTTSTAYFNHSFNRRR